MSITALRVKHAPSVLNFSSSVYSYTFVISFGYQKKVFDGAGLLSSADDVITASNDFKSVVISNQNKSERKFIDLEFDLEISMS